MRCDFDTLFLYLSIAVVVISFFFDITYSVKTVDGQSRMQDLDHGCTSNAHEHYCRSQSPLGSMYTWMFHGHAFLAPVDREWLHTIAFADAIEAALS